MPAVPFGEPDFVVGDPVIASNLPECGCDFEIAACGELAVPHANHGFSLPLSKPGLRMPLAPAGTSSGACAIALVDIDGKRIGPACAYTALLSSTPSTSA